MIELKDFVAESLKQIIEGIGNAQAFAKEKDASINPIGLIHIQENHYQVDQGSARHGLIPQLIEFDIAVTASEGKESKVGVGVFAAAIGLGAQGKIEDANIAVSRVKFSVPVSFPQQR